MTETKEEKARHAAHEMVAFLNVHMALCDPKGTVGHPDVVIHALRTAYATHVRNLLEFFRDKVDRDIKYGDLVPMNQWRRKEKGDWPQCEQDWWLQATQLASHLSSNRPRWGALDEWEERGCEKTIADWIRHAVVVIPELLPGVAETLTVFDTWQSSRST